MTEQSASEHDMTEHGATGHGATGHGHRLDRPTQQDHVRRLLSTPGRWAVVGLSTNRARAAYDVAAYLQSLGHEIVPVHPRAETVHGAPGYRTLEEVPGPIDVVDVFVASERAGAVIASAVRLGVPAVWLQLDVHDAAAEAAARAAGTVVVADTCPKIEGPRLGLGIVRRPRPVPPAQA